MGIATRDRRALRVVVPVVTALAILVPLAWMWQGSLTPSRYSVMSMGVADYGGGPESAGTVAAGAHARHGAPPGVTPETRSVTDLVVDPSRPADVRVELVTRAQRRTVGGRTVDGFTVNGASPGPVIRARVGQLVEVRLRNESVRAGVALHWHGVDVSNAMDGVAGVTQDRVPVGGEFTYRFVLDRSGTYWYHSHQVADAQVAGGLFGPLIVLPRANLPQRTDVLAMAHTYAGVRTLDGQPGIRRVDSAAGRPVRVRVVNTDNGPVPVWVDAPYRVLAIDGNDVRAPTVLAGKLVTVTAGGRVDLEITPPADGSAVRVQISRGSALIIGPHGAAAPPASTQPTAELDPLSYGSPAPLRFDPQKATRRFDYSIGRRPGFVEGRPGLFWSVNGHLFPNVPMFVVAEGDVVVMHLENHSGEVHPMHLHGHRAVVLARNGVVATGSPWWFDSLNVRDGENYDVAFVADNPGIWMDHCHNLQHAAAGMLAHLMYEGVDTPYRLGSETSNDPE